MNTYKNLMKSINNPHRQNAHSTIIAVGILTIQNTSCRKILPPCKMFKLMNNKLVAFELTIGDEKIFDLARSAVTRTRNVQVFH